MKYAFLHPHLVEEIQDLYSAEKQIITVMPSMIKKASYEKLKSGLEQHLEETKQQAAELEKVAKELDMELKGMTCLGMKGILDDARQHIEEKDSSLETDLDIIAGAQRVEHYEVAGYGTAVNYAKQMEHTNASKVLHRIMDEEKKTDETLTKLAEEIIAEMNKE